MKYRLYRFVDRNNLFFVYKSNDLEFLKQMKKVLSQKYDYRFILMEVVYCE